MCPIWKIVTSSFVKLKYSNLLFIQFVVKDKSIIKLDIRISQHDTSAGNENLNHKPVDNRGIYFSCDNHGECVEWKRRGRANQGRNRHLECAPTPESVEAKNMFVQAT